MKKNLILLKKCIISTNSDSRFVLLRNALCRDKWKKATVVDLLPKWLLSGGSPEVLGFVLFCSGSLVLDGC